MNVYQKLNAARTKFHSLKLTKTGHNKFAGYNYFELGDFLIPALKCFDEVGLCAVVSFEANTASMTIFDADKPESSLIISSPMGSAALKGCHEVQNIGAVETYQRRYLWVAALEIVEHDALDATTGKEKEAPKERTGVAQDYLSVQTPLPPDRMAHIENLAGTVKDDFAAYGAQAAFERIDMENLTDLEKVYLSTLLPAATRNPITAYSREYHSKKKP